MHQSFGARLRQQREKRGISLKAISDQTKIKLSLLEGLERDDISQWPSGIFRRAYVRTYAHAIGLNPDVVVHEFFDLYPEPKEAEPPPPQRPNETEAITTRNDAHARLDFVVSNAFIIADAPCAPRSRRNKWRILARGLVTQT